MVVWDITDADMKGFNLPATASGGLMAGILTEAVAAGQDTDKIQRLGEVDALVDGDSQDVTAGDSLKPVDGSPNLLQDAAGAMSSALKGITALEANTGVAALKSVFINLP